LLGQYSDDEEEDEEAADQPTGETNGSPRDANAKAIHFHNLYCRATLS
jgi:formin-binding protein 4